jgi:hypothetical protein
MGPKTRLTGTDTPALDLERFLYGESLPSGSDPKGCALRLKVR